MELNFKDEDKLKEFLKTINYNFNIVITKDAGGVTISDLDKDILEKADAYDDLKEQIEDLQDEISDLEDRLYDAECSG